jgi:hypothetical protein
MIPFLAPIVDYLVSSHVKNFVLGKQRQVPVKVVTLSSIFKEQGLE